MRIASICLATLLWGVPWIGQARAQNPAHPKQQAAPQQKAETFLQKVLRISGIAATPATLKGPGDEIVHGQIWIADLTSGHTRKLTSAGGFRSPVFVQMGSNILGLKDSAIVRISLSDGKVTNLYLASGISKLVGAGIDDPDKILVLLRGNSDLPAVAFLSASTGKLASLSYDRSSADDRHMVEHLLGWDRNYGDTTLYTDERTKAGLSGTLSWTDVFLRKQGNAPVDVSKCNGVNCGQPSLSPDGKFVAYIRADED